MKTIILFMALIFALTLSGVEFHTYQEALELQKQNKKIIMIDVMRTGCHYCSDMKKEVFDDPEMTQWLQQRFIISEINLDYETIPFDVEIHFTPTFLFVNSKNQIVKKIPGSWNIQDFKDLTKEIK